MRSVRDNPAMDVNSPADLLGGLSPARFMRRHWQKKPLLVRQAWPGVVPPLSRSALFDLVAQEGVESRLLTRKDSRWSLRHGPFARRSLPPLKRPNWTLLVQGLDLHLQAAHEMLARFNFIPAARLDDLMLSYASDGGGVGPHLDSYDVFLLQVKGQRRWRIGLAADRSLIEGLPLKILRHFEPSDEWLLEPGDMLYLPPGWAHDGVAEGECMTCSIGLRASSANVLARELLARLGDDLDLPRGERLYRDAGQSATTQPGRIPAALRGFAEAALRRATADHSALACALGGVLSEPKPSVCFEARDEALMLAPVALHLDRRSRMMYDDQHVFINGEAFRASGRDAQVMAGLADQRRISAADLRSLSRGARGLLDEWWRAGWLHTQ